MQAPDFSGPPRQYVTRRNRETGATGRGRVTERNLKGKLLKASEHDSGRVLGQGNGGVFDYNYSPGCKASRVNELLSREQFA